MTPSPLTAREQEIAILVAKGHTYKHISSLLNISKSTIDKHTTNIHTKLRVHCNIDVVRWLISNNYLTLTSWLQPPWPESNNPLQLQEKEVLKPH